MKKIFFLGFLFCLTSLVADENKSFEGSVPEKKLHKEHAKSTILDPSISECQSKTKSTADNQGFEEMKQCTGSKKERISKREYMSHGTSKL